MGRRIRNTLVVAGALSLGLVITVASGLIRNSSAASPCLANEQLAIWGYRSSPASASPVVPRSKAESVVGRDVFVNTAATVSDATFVHLEGTDGTATTPHDVWLLDVSGAPDDRAGGPAPGDGPWLVHDGPPTCVVVVVDGSTGHWMMNLLQGSLTTGPAPGT